MKQLLLLAFLLAIGVFFSCNNNPVTPTNPGSFQGEWTVDKVQMVSAPSGGGLSAMMKQALVPFGDVDGSFAGYMDFKFGAETVVATSTSLGGGQSYFVGNTGYYMRSTSLHKSLDGGNSWNNITFPFSFSSISAFVKDANTIYVIGYNSGILILIKSTDQGASWNTLNNNMKMDIGGGGYLNKTFCFVNNTTGFGVAYSFLSQSMVLYKTTNEGIDWSIAYTFPQNQSFHEIHFSSESKGLAIFNDIPPNSNRQIFSKTNDGGVTWTNNYSPSDFHIYNHFQLNENVIWINGVNEEGKSCLYKSNDGAQTWNLITDKMFFREVKFVNENTGYGFTFDEFFVKTVNGGVSWSTYSTPSDFQPGNFHLFGDQPVSYNGNKFWKPSGIIDTTKWTANGMITNSVIQLITRAYPIELRANGDFQTSSNNIVFTVYNYLNTHNKVGMGTFSFENNYLNIELNLPNDEKWKIKLRRK